MLNKLKNRLEIILFIGMALLACLLMTGATPKLPALPKTEKILWTGYWDTGEWKDNNSYEYYCVVSEKKFLRTLTVFKQTAKEYKKIFSYSNYDGFIMAYSSDDKILFTYWSAGSLNSLRIFECDPVKDKVKMTFEKGFIDNPNEVEADDGTSYLIIKDVNTLGEQALSQMTAIFYQRVPGNGYSKFTTCKWDDRYLMMDAISKATTANK